MSRSSLSDSQMDVEPINYIAVDREQSNPTSAQNQQVLVCQNIIDNIKQGNVLSSYYNPKKKKRKNRIAGTDVPCNPAINIINNNNNNDDQGDLKEPSPSNWKKRLEEDSKERSPSISLTREILSIKSLIQPNDLDYWQVWIELINRIGIVLEEFIENTILFQTKATTIMKDFWMYEFVQLSAEWIGLHYCTSYVYYDKTLMSLASTLNLRRMRAITLQYLLNPPLILIDHFETIKINSKIESINVIFAQLNLDSEDPLDLLTIANNYKQGTILNDKQDFWTKQLQQIFDKFYLETLYSETPINEINRHWKDQLHKLDYVCYELFINEEYMDLENNNSLKIFEIYTRWLHWISIQLYYLNKNQCFRVMFDAKTYDLTNNLFITQLKYLDTDSEIPSFRDFIFKFHLAGGSLYYYIQRNPDVFITFFNKNVDRSFIVPDANIVLSDTHKQYIVDYINLKFQSNNQTSNFSDLYNDRKHFLNEFVVLQLFQSRMHKKYAVNWIEEYVLTNYMLSSHHHWKIHKWFLDSEREFVRMPIVCTFFGQYFVLCNDLQSQQHKTLICDNSKHALLTWLWCVCHFHGNVLEDMLKLEMDTVSCNFLSEFALDVGNTDRMLQSWNINLDVLSSKHFSIENMWKGYEDWVKCKKTIGEQFKKAEDTILKFREMKAKQKREKEKQDKPYEQMLKQEKKIQIEELAHKEQIGVMSDIPIHNSEEYQKKAKYLAKQAKQESEDNARIESIIANLAGAAPLATPSQDDINDNNNYNNNNSLGDWKGHSSSNPSSSIKQLTAKYPKVFELLKKKK